MNTKRFLTLFFLTILLLTGRNSASASGTIFVDTPCNSANTYCTIQSAVTAANNGDTIQIADGDWEEYVTIPAGKVVTIEGSGTTTLLPDPNSAASAILTVDGTLTLREVEVRNANIALGSGGGIAVNAGGSLTVADAVIRNNSALLGGGIWADINTTVTIAAGSQLVGNRAATGGGIYSKGNLTVDQAELQANDAQSSGGGIYSTSQLNVTRSIIRQGEAGTDGAGIYVGANGTATLIHNHIYTNRADRDGGGVFGKSGSHINLYYTYLSGNNAVGDGSAFAGDVIVMAGSAVSGSSNVCDAATLTGLALNLIDDSTTTGCEGLIAQEAAILTDDVNAQMNDSAETSVIRDAITDPLWCGTGEYSVDIDGNRWDGACDIGHNEFGASFYVDVTNGACDDGVGAPFCTIQAAIDANVGDEIAVLSGEYHERLSVDRAITLIGHGENRPIIDGDAAGSVIEASADLTLTAIEIRNGFALNGGGIVVDSADLTLTDVYLHDNVAQAVGGAIFVEDGDITIKNSTLISNTANANGGAIAWEYQHPDFDDWPAFAPTARFDVIETTVENNQAVMSGGGIHINSDGFSAMGASGFIGDSRVSLVGSTFRNNLAQDGGALYCTDRYVAAATDPINTDNQVTPDNARLTIQSTTLHDNRATDTGGAIHTTCETDISSSTIRDNTAGTNGGGVAQLGTTQSGGGSLTTNISVATTTIASNSADANGANLYLAEDASNHDLTLMMEDTTVSDGAAGISGGGIYADTVAQMRVENSTVTANKATAGTHALHFMRVGSADWQYVTIAFNGTDSQNDITLEGNTSFSPLLSILFGNCGDDAGSAYLSQGRNLYNATCPLGDATDVQVTDESAELYSSLSDQGGTTQTLPLRATSQAINLVLTNTHANCDGVIDDQRGIVRGTGDAGTGCDAGAYEFDGTVVVPTAVGLKGVGVRGGGSAEIMLALFLTLFTIPLWHRTASIGIRH